MTDIDDVLAGIEDPDLMSEVYNGWVQGNYTPMPSDDSAQFLIDMPYHSTPTIYSDSCYICNDPEFAMMGMPLCFACPECNGHIAADDPDCECGYSAYEDWLDSQA